MAKLGDDVYGWNVEQLVSWLQTEGLNDCVKTFVFKKIDGCKLLNLTDGEIKNLHVSLESKKKLLKAVEKFHRRKKEKLGRMFGGQGDGAQRVVARKPPSLSNDEGASDDEGWDSEEWDSDSAGGETSSDGGGEYLEPDDDTFTPTGAPHEKETASVTSGLVAQLKEGIAAQSFTRNTAPQPQDFEDEDIYDVPPEEDGDIYEEPSDSSGGAIVVRPPPKPSRVGVNDTDYILTRGGEEEQDMYEAPMEGEDISPALPVARGQKQFIPTKVAQGNKFVGVPDINDNTETYDIPDLADDEEDSSYEFPEPEDLDDDEEGSSYEFPDPEVVVPPLRPPKNIGKPAVPAAQPIPPRPLKQMTPSNTAKSPAKPMAISRHGTPFQSQSNTLPSQGSPIRHLKPNAALPQHSRPNTLPTSPTHGVKVNSLSQQGTPFRVQTSNLSPQKSPIHHPKPPPMQPKATAPQGTQKPIPSQPKFPPQPFEQKKPLLTPKVLPRPRPAADPTRRGPAAPPGNEPARKSSGPPDSPTNRISGSAPPPGNEPARKFSGPKSGTPDSPKRIPGPAEGRMSPRSSKRSVSHRDPGPEVPQKGGPPHAMLPGSGRRPLPQPEAHEKPSIPEPSSMQLTPPPRPPKQSPSTPLAQPALSGRQVPVDRKSTPLPTPPTEKKSVPLPGLPLEKKSVPPPPMNSHPSLSSNREQSSGSSIESGSADEPVVPLGQKKKTTTPTQRYVPPNRGLPPTPSESKGGSLDIMKEAPWFHGAADRKRCEVNLKATNMDGAFLIRNSTKNPNDYSLSLLYKGNIRHLKLPKKDGKYVLGTSGVQQFESIIDLVSYHRQHEVDLASGGKTKLTIHAQDINR